MFKSAGCHQTGKIFENTLWQNVSTQSPQVLFDRMNYIDHLGNIRLSYTTDPLSGSTNNIKILEENNYYPFGLKHGLYNTPARDIRPVGVVREVEMVSDNPYNYRYNGKEWQGELGLNVTFMDFRQYDNALGRFMNPDALSELYYAYSPYNFVGNMALYFSDPTGLEWYKHKESGEYKYFDGTGDRDGWTHVGSSVSFYDDKTGNFVNGNTQYDDNGNELGTTHDILDSDGNFLEQGYLIGLSDVVAYGTRNNRNGSFAQLSLNNALIGGFGISLGIVSDSYNNWDFYVTFNANVGLGFNVGLDTGQIIPKNENHKFTTTDFQGRNANYSVGVSTPIIDIGASKGGSILDFSNENVLSSKNLGQGPTGYTIKSGNVGKGTGYGLGAMATFGETILIR